LFISSRHGLESGEYHLGERAVHALVDTNCPHIVETRSTVASRKSPTGVQAASSSSSILLDIEDEDDDEDERNSDGGRAALEFHDECSPEEAG
jgi:hypothetical protein